ncbi:hypothetical protein [Nocardioides nitrophenolicus]|uniref:hypothetical protein n=1 Tax=Nocardioides nitrophenolicus TaxID=60489 RepID=UPI001959BEA6|nr:hypothetical protein [Nocardioides nitrophenolicus]MBM7518295.1 hypothetical protein [Nocardioides nitrophenolicus]
MSKISLTPITVNITGPDGDTTQLRYCTMGRHALWLESSLRGRELRRRLRESTALDRRQRRRFMRLFGRGWEMPEVAA